MFETLRDLFDGLLPPSPDADPQAAEHALQLAAAMMLVEVMRADPGFHSRERAAVHNALRDEFMLSVGEAACLVELADATAKEATDLFAFTSRINDRFEMPQKLRMVEHMWRVAYADGTLSAGERHIIWRIADLLHVPQGAYVNARMRAAQQAGAA
ncbi:MAG: TerB family tellurite resistance protein [Caldimonas sp.]